MQSTLKRSVKLSISMLVLTGRYVGDVFRRILGKNVPGQAVVLYYHSIRPEQRSRFAAQMDQLLKFAEPVEADFRGHIPAGVRLAAVTFDDGFASFQETALPELKKRGIPSTLFVVAQRLGCYPDWPGYVPDPTFKEAILTEEQLCRLPPNLVTIGSHTLTHATLTALAEQEARHELVESREELEKTLGRKITLFSFPHGAFHEKLVDWCRESSYERVYTILPVPAFSVPDEYVVGRVWTDPTDWPIEFKLKLIGAYFWLPLAFSLKRRMLSTRAVRTLRHVVQHAG